MKGIIDFLKKNKDIIYLVCISIYFISTIIIKKTNFADKIEPILKLLRYVVLVPIILKIILLDLKNYNKKNIIIVSVLIVFSFLECFFTPNGKTIIQYLIIVLGSYNIEFRRIIKYILITEIATISMIIILSIIGIIPNYEYIRTTTEIARYSLGFAYPSFSAIFVYSLTCIYLFYKDKETKIADYIILFVINIIIFIITNTKFELACSLIVISFSIIYKFCSNKMFDKVMIYIAKYSIFFLAIISIIISYTYSKNNNNYVYINKLLSNRLYLMNQGVKEYGIPTFGKDIDWIDQNEIKNGDKKGEKENVVDNGYINIILNYGWIFLLILGIGFYILVELEERKNNKFTKYILIVLFIHTFINPQLMQIVYNPFLILLATSIFENIHKDTIKEV